MILSRRRKNPLRHLIFSDGLIKKVTQTGNDVVLDFSDYCDSTIRIIFHEASSVKAAEGLYRYEVMGAHFEKSPAGWTMRLTDDDDDLLLKLTYQDAEYTFLRRSGDPPTNA